LLRSALERDGLNVLTTGSGAEAITLAGSAAPDLIVLELRLPDVPGEAVAREVRRSSRVPILVLTAKAGEDDRIRGLDLGADDYVTKPFSPGRSCCGSARFCAGPRLEATHRTRIRSAGL
jgi:DNA-binding response OmpR family regulator